MMTSVASSVPIFEVFYDEHKHEVLAYLRKRAGSDRADDLFQETFLRALRAYDRLQHAEHLRAWVLTIASRVLIDAFRREGTPTSELPELESPEPESPLDSIADLTDCASAEGAGGGHASLRLRPRLRPDRRRSRFQ